MKWLKVGAVIFGALVITALGIDAADTLSGSRGTLLGQVFGSAQTGKCPTGMIQATTAQTFTCVDIYEAGTNEECPHTVPENDMQTRENLENQKCAASSAPHVAPWRFITREQANTACMKAGKRLPKSDEWYLFSVGTQDNALVCNSDSGSLSNTGDHSECLSAVGVQDAIGNVWEWTSDDVIEGMYQGRSIPSSGYVAQVDAGGVSTLTNQTDSELFYKDYFWSSKEGSYGMMRGGFYGSKSDAGIYTIHAETLPTAAGTAIGFRCIK